MRWEYSNALYYGRSQRTTLDLSRGKVKVLWIGLNLILIENGSILQCKCEVITFESWNLRQKIQLK